MSRQNIYDNNTFFDGYRKLRNNSDSANNLEEKPALFSMIGDLNGKSILDLGCGYGENCTEYHRMGARRIVGIDISEKMLDVAKKENNITDIQFRNMCMEDVTGILETFDVVVSSLAIHYIEDFDSLAKSVYTILKETGVFLFSQEHPLTTAPIDGPRWIKNDLGEVDHYRLTDYAHSGKRNVSWIVDDVEKYHRTFSDLMNGLIKAGFGIEEIREPIPSDETRKRLPTYEKHLHKPNFLLIKARKRV